MENIANPPAGGLDLAALIAAAAQAAIAEYAATHQPAATSGTFLPRILLKDLAAEALDGYTKSSKRTYAPYVTFLVHGWPERPDLFPGFGDLRVDEILPKHLQTALNMVNRRARALIEERNAVREALGRCTRPTTGTSAAYNAVGAWRWLFRYAEANRYLSRGSNPADELTKPSRIDGTRMAFTDVQMRQVYAVASGTGDDPELDALIVETILVTGARREGLVNLTVDGLDRDECVVLLDEKFGKVTPQPVPDWFFDKLSAFAASRGAERPGDHVFRKRSADGLSTSPITSRRFDNIFATRLQSAYEWADKEKVGAHTVRHHAITLVERTAGKAVARAFARHSSADVTDIYTGASQQEVARAVVGLYGGDHPWLHREPRARTRTQI